MAGLLPPIFVELKANASEFHAEMGKARAEIAHLETAGSAGFQKLAAVGKAALMGIASAAVTVGTEAVHMADKFEISHVRLETAIKNSGSSFNAWKTQIEASDSSMEKLGFTNAQTEQALGTLVAGTGSTKKALAEMATAADIARFKNIDLNDASFMLTRALQGNSRVLKQLGIDLPIPVKGAQALKDAQEAVKVQTENYTTALERFHEKTKTTKADIEALKTAHDHLLYSQQQLTLAQGASQTILDAINQKIGGTAVAASETFSGKLATLRARTEDLGKNLGVWLIPKIEALVAATMSAVTWMEHHKTIAEALGVVIGTGLTLAIGAYIIKMGQSVVATTVGVGKQIAAWTGFTTSVTADSATIVTASTTAATESSAAWIAAFGTATTSAEAFTAAADAAFLSVVGAAGTAGTEAGSAFSGGLIAGAGKYSKFLLGGAAAVGLDIGAHYAANKFDKAIGQPNSYSSLDALIAGEPGAQKLLADAQARRAAAAAGTHRNDYADLAAGYAGSSTHRTDYADLAAVYTASGVEPPVIPPAPTTYGGGGGGGSAGPKPPKPLTPAQIAAAKFATTLTNLGSKISTQANLNPGSLGMAKVYEKAETATLKEAEAAKKHAAALVKAAHGAKAKEAATKVLAQAQADVNKATKNLLGIKKDEKTLLDAQKQAALDAAQAAAALANAKIEAGLDFSNAVSVAQAKVTEAQNTLNADQVGSLQYYQDLAALHQAQVDLTNVIAQNTQATISNTTAMTQPLNQLPTYLANRATVNAGAYAGGMNVNVSSMSGQQLLTSINAELRRNGKPPLT